MVWQGVIQSLAPLLGGAVFLWFANRRRSPEDEDEWLEPIGSAGVLLAFAVVVFMWLLPAGAFLAIPLALLLSVLSPAAREAWNEHRRMRLMAIGVALLVLASTGFLPVDEPVAPDAWGQPLFTENPHAPAYPASEQYTWVTAEAVVLQSVSMRLPHQTGVLGAEWTAMTLASWLNMENDRMHQAIDLIDEELPFQLNPEDILLESAPAPTHLDVRISSDASIQVEHRSYLVKTTAIGMDPNGFVVGEVSTASLASWGGQLDMLIIVRPLAHPSLGDDPTGETWIREWLEAHGSSA